jgi:DNA-binding HxlR family transcriptional regulator
MPKRTYQQYCPVAEALDVVGERWTLLIVRELLVGPQRYTDLKAAMPTMASNLLGDRLAELIAAGLVERVDADDNGARGRYALTPAGRDLEGVIGALARWGMRRLPPPDAEVTVSPLMVSRAALLAYLRPRRAGRERLVVETVLDGTSTTLVVDGGRGSIHPGPPVRQAPDVTIEGAARDLLLVRLGRTSLDEALAADVLRLSGTDTSIARFRDAFAIDAPARSLSEADRAVADLADVTPAAPERASTG